MHSSSATLSTPVDFQAAVEYSRPVIVSLITRYRPLVALFKPDSGVRYRERTSERPHERDLAIGSSIVAEPRG